MVEVGELHVLAEKLQRKAEELRQTWIFPSYRETGSVVLAHCARCGPSSNFITSLSLETTRPIDCGGNCPRVRMIAWIAGGVYVNLPRSQILLK